MGRRRRTAALTLFTFLIAHLLDRRTGRRHSNLLGSAALGVATIILWPWRRSILRDTGGYCGTWAAFALARAGARRIERPALSPTAAARLECLLFGGNLPTASLHRHRPSPGVMRPVDLAAIAVHGSFFVVPTAVAMALLHHDRRQFTRYWTATAITLTLSTTGFVLWPTTPPWMHAPDEVRRVIIETGRALRLVPLESCLGRDANDRTLPFDPNPLAAMPSVHVGAAVLVALASRNHRPVIRWLGSAYAVGMSASVVYLGEHYIVDALGGWLVAGIGWRATRNGRCEQTQGALS